MKRNSFSCAILLSSLCGFFALPGFGAVLSPAVDGSIIDGLYWGAKDGVGDSADDDHILLQVLNTVHWEQRSVYEFRSQAGSTSSARLVLPVWTSMGPYPLRLDLYAYAGDGAVDPSDFGAGSHVASLLFSNQPRLIFDVTEVISNFSAAGSHYVGFILRTEFSPILPNGPAIALFPTEQDTMFENYEPPVLLVNDVDGDGVIDSHDQCPDTPRGTLVTDAGCNLEQLCLCDGASKQAYLRCVKQFVETLYHSGRLTKDQARALLRQASRSNCWR